MSQVVSVRFLQEDICLVTPTHQAYLPLGSCVTQPANRSYSRYSGYQRRHVGSSTTEARSDPQSNNITDSVISDVLPWVDVSI